jgi:hypothetical protein
MSKLLIGLSGLIGSGKDTIADYLCNFHGFRRESWANSLKDAVSIIFGWDRLMVEGRTTQAREWREEVDSWWAERLGIPHLTPRWVLQNWGTNVLREHFHDDIWVASLEHKLLATKDNIVITDCRFPNEVSSIHSIGGICIRVTRGPEPSWLELATKATHDKRIALLLERSGVHASEFSHVGLEYDSVIKNDGTIIDLHNRIDELLNRYH